MNTGSAASTQSASKKTVAPQMAEGVRCTILIVGAFVASCGKNDGTRVPSARTFPDSFDADRNIDGSQKHLSVNSRWRAEMEFFESPVFDPDSVKEHKGVLQLWGSTGQNAFEVKSVKLIAINIQSGLGTGNLKPIITAYNGRSDLFHIGNLFFNRSGTWVLKVSAEVNGAQDIWFANIEVR